MGSSNVEESSSIEEVKGTDRPNFYPCVQCGEKFTFRALNVHRLKCKDSDSCSCICCSQKAKRRRLNPELENAKEVCEQSKTPSINEKTLQTISQNSNIPTSNLKKILLIPTVNGIIKPLTLTFAKNIAQRSDLLNGSTVQNGQAANEGERAISVIRYNPCVNGGNSASNSENMVAGGNKEAGELEVQPTAKSKDRPIPLKKIFHPSGEECRRKMFCAMCNKHVYWGTYGNHVIEHCEMVDDKPKCPICSSTSATKANFLMHFYEHYSTHPTNCPECKCSDESCHIPFSKTEHSYAARNFNLCFICRDMFTHFQSLINHMRLHSSENPFHCTECPRKFRQVGNLTRHMTTHRGIKPHKCCQCEKSFADPATLRNHVRTHTKETPYVCTVCNRGFSQVGNLKRHKVVHDQHALPRPSLPTGEEPSASNVGDNPTAPKVSTDPPRKGRHPQEDLLECTECGKKFAWSYDLETHYRVHSGEKPYECDICKKRFAQSGAVRMHKVRHHNVVETDSSQPSNPTTEI